VALPPLVVDCSNGNAKVDIATILGCAENTVKILTARIFAWLGMEARVGIGLFERRNRMKNA
jgi:DNA-binding CsgD family transcriptional regulator